jgi:hypothetical protein
MFLSRIALQSLKGSIFNRRTGDADKAMAAIIIIIVISISSAVIMIAVTIILINSRHCLGVVVYLACVSRVSWNSTGSCECAKQRILPGTEAKDCQGVWIQDNSIAVVVLLRERLPRTESGLGRR